MVMPGGSCLEGSMYNMFHMHYGKGPSLSPWPNQLTQMSVNERAISYTKSAWKLEWQSIYLKKKNSEENVPLDSKTTLW